MNRVLLSNSRDVEKVDWKVVIDLKASDVKHNKMSGRLRRPCA